VIRDGPPRQNPQVLIPNLHHSVLAAAGWETALPPALWEALWLTLRLAFSATAVLLVLGLPLANWLNLTLFRGAAMLEALVGLPIVLPPTVIGFYLLVLLSPRHPLGAFWLRLTGGTLTFSFSGLLIGSIVYSLPFAVGPFQSALRGVPAACIEAMYALGATSRQVFWRVRLPMARRGILAGAMLCFAHTTGEFGVVLMLGGSIPGKTKVASIALYDEVQKLNYPVAHAYAAILAAFSFSLLFAMALLQRRRDRAADQ
jgi:molybdate transport system permease protein